MDPARRAASPGAGRPATSGLSKPTVSQALTALETPALVREAAAPSGGKGPTAVLYELNPRPAGSWASTSAAGWVRAAIADLTGEIAARRDERPEAAGARTLIAQVGGRGPRPGRRGRHRLGPGHVATVGSPGVLEPSRGEVALAHNLPGWGRPGLLAALREELGTEHQGRERREPGGEGERWRGLGKEVGQLRLPARRDGRRAWGSCWTASCTGARAAPPARSATCPSRRRRPRPPAGAGAPSRRRSAGPAWSPRAGRRHAGPLSAKKVFAAARRGDPLRRRWSGRGGRIALAIAAVMAVVDPELVILGGGVGGNGDLLLDPLERELRDDLPVPAPPGGLGPGRGRRAPGGRRPGVEIRTGPTVRTIGGGSNDDARQGGSAHATTAHRHRRHGAARRRLHRGSRRQRPAATVDPNAHHAPLTLTVWGFFSGRELGVFTAVVKTSSRSTRG